MNKIIISIRNVVIGIRKNDYIKVFYNMSHIYKNVFISLKLQKYINTYKKFILIKHKSTIFIIIKNLKIFQ